MTLASVSGSACSDRVAESTDSVRQYLPDSAYPIVCIDDRIRDIVREEVRAALGQGAAGFYSTVYGTWPPGCRSRRMARERIRVVPGHEQTGNGRATVWRVAVDAYRAHHGRKAPFCTAVVQNGLSDDELAERALVASGLRQTRAVS